MAWYVNRIVPKNYPMTNRGLRLPHLGETFLLCELTHPPRRPLRMSHGEGVGTARPLPSFDAQVQPLRSLSAGGLCKIEVIREYSNIAGLC